MRPFFLLIIGILIFAGPAFGQTRLSGPTPSILFTTAPSGHAMLSPWVADTNTPTSHPTHWKEGALIGGIAGALGGALLGNAICQAGDDIDSSCGGATVGGALAGAIGLGLIGALIGGAFPKQE